MSSDDESSVEVDVVEPETKVVISETEARLAHLRRGARDKAPNRFEGKLAGLKSAEEIQRENSMTRIKEGLNHVLMLHTPVELSSVCGVLGLKVQQKPKQSLEQIMGFALSDPKQEEGKLNKVLSCLWEGALFEYLRAIGHPVYNELNDPRLTVAKIWQQGGILETRTAFTPHFVRREVKRRYANVQAEDITSRLGKLRLLQEAVKRAERTVVFEHDYTNILQYFQAISELRKMENEVRDYLVAEVETSRQHAEVYYDTCEDMRENLRDCEYMAAEVSQSLIHKLAETETVCETFARNKYDLECQLQRLNTIVDSYLAAQTSSSKPGAKLEQLAVGEYRNIQDAHPSIQQLYNKIATFKQRADNFDIDLRDRSSEHVEEIDRLQNIIRSLEYQLNLKTIEAEVQTERADRLDETVKFCVGKIIRMNQANVTRSAKVGASCNYWAARCQEMESNMKRITPMVLAGMQHSNPEIIQICNMLVDHLKLSNEAELTRVREAVVKENERIERERMEALLEYKRSLQQQKGNKSKSNARGSVVTPKTPVKPGSAASAAGKPTPGTDALGNPLPVADAKAEPKEAAGKKGAAAKGGAKPGAKGDDAKKKKK